MRKKKNNYANKIGYLALSCKPAHKNQLSSDWASTVQPLKTCPIILIITFDQSKNCR